MGNANIEESLRKEILHLLKNPTYKAKYQNLKGFIDNACLSELEKVKKGNVKRS